MGLNAQITLINGEVWVCPVTLKVLYEWEEWSGQTATNLDNPSIKDMAYICWRSAYYARRISKFVSLDHFARKVNGWDIVRVDNNIGDTVEEWLNNNET